MPSRLLCLAVLCFALSAADPASSILVDNAGGIWLPDPASGTRHWMAGQVLSRPQGPPTRWLALDEAGMFATFEFRSRFTRLTGRSTQPAVLASPASPLAIGRDGIYFMDTGSGKPQLSRFGVNGIVTPLMELAAPLTALAFSPGGTLYVTDGTGIGKLTGPGTIAAFLAPVAVPGCKADASLPRAPALRSLVIGLDGSVYAAAAGCRGVLRISPNRTVIVVHTTAAPWMPVAVTLVGFGDLYVLEAAPPANPKSAGMRYRVRAMPRVGKPQVVVEVNQ